MDEISYGLDLKTNTLKHIDEVENGEKCGCVCPYCNTPLIAKHGNTNTHHFAHKNADCGQAYETAVHVFAKEIIEKHKKIAVNLDLYELENNKYLVFDKVELEKVVDDIKPDIIGYKNGEQFFIEICVTHAIDEEKLNKIKKLNITTIEINLENLNRDMFLIQKNTIEKDIIHASNNKEIIYSKLEYERKIQIQKMRFDEAFNLLEEANQTKCQHKVNSALILMADIEDEQKKQILLYKLEDIQKEINIINEKKLKTEDERKKEKIKNEFEEKITDVLILVEIAERTISTHDIENASNSVNKLTYPEEKTECVNKLKQRLYILNEIAKENACKELSEKLFTIAKNAIEQAEKTGVKYDLWIAQDKINRIDYGEERDKLQDRFDILYYKIYPKKY